MSVTASTLDAPRVLLDAKQVAARLGCSWRTVYRLADSGDLPFGVKLGALRRWDSVEIDQFIASGCKPVRKTGKGASRAY